MASTGLNWLTRWCAIAPARRFRPSTARPASAATLTCANSMHTLKPASAKTSCALPGFHCVNSRSAPAKPRPWMRAQVNTKPSRKPSCTGLPRQRVQPSKAAIPTMVAAMAGSTMRSDADQPPQWARSPQAQYRASSVEVAKRRQARVALRLLSPAPGWHRHGSSVRPWTKRHRHHRLRLSMRRPAPTAPGTLHH